MFKSKQISTISRSDCNCLVRHDTYEPIMIIFQPNTFTTTKPYTHLHTHTKKILTIHRKMRDNSIPSQSIGIAFVNANLNWAIIPSILCLCISSIKCNFMGETNNTTNAIQCCNSFVEFIYFEKKENCFYIFDK